MDLLPHERRWVYRRLGLNREFLRVYVLPVLALGGRAIHIPHHTTWELEVADPKAIDGIEFPVLSTITDVPALLADWA